MLCAQESTSLGVEQGVQAEGSAKWGWTTAQHHNRKGMVHAWCHQWQLWATGREEEGQVCVIRSIEDSEVPDGKSNRWNS